MRTLIIAFLLLLICCTNSCSGNSASTAPLLPSIKSPESAVPEVGHHSGRFLNWGTYRLEIARDGSSVQILPDRSFNTAWGHDLNVLKFLEVTPCTNCLTTGNVHKLANGDISVDVSIRHPYLDPAYTGFDVRGIILFPASQLFPDDELRIQAGFEPLNNWKYYRYSTHEKGDAELMNPDGWTTIWAPDIPEELYFQIEKGFDITDYYPGKYASGENLGTINAFKRFHSTENRHMFEAGKTVTCTYIIRPPAEGPIEASYSIYAHWAEPLNMPVTDPFKDFGPEANSPLPYDFYISQDAILDPDVLHEENGPHVIWHIKTWAIGCDLWLGTVWDLMYDSSPGGNLEKCPNGKVDEYGLGVFDTRSYKLLPGALPGEWPYIFRLQIKDPNKPWGDKLGTDFYIAKIAIGPSDGG
jgi:hypothetical protein